MIKIKKENTLPVPSDELILEFERVYRVKLPENYISFLKKNNGVRSAIKAFMFDADSHMVGRFLCLLGDKISEYEEGDYDIEVVMTRNDVIMCDDPDLIGANIIPILELSGGNYVCFDYRNNDLKPEICIWFWDKSEKFKAFTKKLANSFDEFITILNSGEFGFDWGNPESEATYGTTFKEHGSHHQVKDLMIKAKANKQQFGQWTNDQQAADFIAKIAQKRGVGTHDVTLPNELPRRLFLASGIQDRADMARVIVNPDGSVQTAYPFNSHHPH